MDDEEDDRDADAGIGNVERGPWMRERHVQIEEREIDHVTVEESVGQVAHNSGEQKRE